VDESTKIVDKPAAFLQWWITRLFIHIIRSGYPHVQIVHNPHGGKAFAGYPQIHSRYYYDYSLPT
jgi:hypothetical protein